MEDKENITSKKHLYPPFKKPVLLAFGLAIIVVAMALIYYFLWGSEKPKNASSASHKTIIFEKITPTLEPNQTLEAQYQDTGRTNIRIYPSLDRRFSFYIYPSQEEGKCIYGIKDKKGGGLDISEVFGSYTVSCHLEQGRIESTFAGWADDNRFVVEDTPGKIKIFTVTPFNLELYQYDTNSLEFVSANRSLEHFLFRKNGQDGGASYTILDRNKNVTLELIDLGSKNIEVLYDEVNDGFLFIIPNVSNNIISVKFDFLSLNDLSLRNILTTDPALERGMGCYPRYLISEPGEVILTQGCIQVDSKYVSDDGHLHIPL